MLNAFTDCRLEVSSAHPDKWFLQLDSINEERKQINAEYAKKPTRSRQRCSGAYRQDMKMERQWSAEKKESSLLQTLRKRFETSGGVISSREMKKTREETLPWMLRGRVKVVPRGRATRRHLRVVAGGVASKITRQPTVISTREKFVSSAVKMATMRYTVQRKEVKKAVVEPGFLLE